MNFELSILQHPFNTFYVSIVLCWLYAKQVAKQRVDVYVVEVGSLVALLKVRTASLEDDVHVPFRRVVAMLAIEVRQIVHAVVALVGSNDYVAAVRVRAIVQMLWYFLLLPHLNVLNLLQFLVDRVAIFRLSVSPIGRVFIFFHKSPMILSSSAICEPMSRHCGPYK